MAITNPTDTRPHQRALLTEHKSPLSYFNLLPADIINHCIIPILKASHDDYIAMFFCPKYDDVPLFILLQCVENTVDDITEYIKYRINRSINYIASAMNSMHICYENKPVPAAHAMILAIYEEISKYSTDVVHFYFVWYLMNNVATAGIFAQLIRRHPQTFTHTCLHYMFLTTIKYGMVQQCSYILNHYPYRDFSLTDKVYGKHFGYTRPSMNMVKAVSSLICYHDDQKAIATFDWLINNNIILHIDIHHNKIWTNVIGDIQHSLQLKTIEYVLRMKPILSISGQHQRALFKRINQEKHIFTAFLCDDEANKALMQKINDVAHLSDEQRNVILAVIQDHNQALLERLDDLL